MSQKNLKEATLYLDKKSDLTTQTEKCLDSSLKSDYNSMSITKYKIKNKLYDKVLEHLKEQLPSAIIGIVCFYFTQKLIVKIKKKAF